jgi:cyclophilin family peptidyl-prolyl cis-trans isomerase
MATPQEVKEGWSNAQESIDSGDYAAALSSLREIWASNSKDADVHQTWSLVADAQASKATASGRSGDYRKSIRHYEKALDKGAGKDVRRRMNRVRSEMDERGIGMGGFRLVDDGAPTVYGIFAIVVVGMLLLVSLRYMDEGLNLSDLFNSGKESDQPTSSGLDIAQMTISYVPAGSTASQTVVVILDLNRDAAPVHVDNFVKLAQRGDFDNTPFHRVIDDFMIQGGDYTNGDGTGGHAAEFYGFCDGTETATPCPNPTSYTVPDEADNGLLHLPCTISMAKTSNPNTGGSQFFLIPEDSTPNWLDGQHTVFGSVTSGCSFITSISQVETGGQSESTPVHAVTLESVVIS